SSRKLVNIIGTDIRDHEVVIFDLSKATHIDDSAAHLLAQVIDRAKQSRTQIVVLGLSDRVRGPLFAFGVLDRLSEDHIVATEKEARDLAWSLL
ncbi:MAG: STAS domain-containing protein, partial [Alphaproteobacteria bacterium]|nr:STAS domain-containing protein [Alphaproteobacteria bacterium]